ncbi:unnamed protein product [Prorocentrum cordatum]|uniref:ER lumen protein-retaining receptor n=1 Tax=Prorocentrum cordatum TaxID=2364126 RepID=A0ABN9Y930_9DINO|nr:unnamed protein product [Polarella glacialis]
MPHFPLPMRAMRRQNSPRRFFLCRPASAPWWRCPSAPPRPLRGIQIYDKLGLLPKANKQEPGSYRRNFVAMSFLYVVITAMALVWYCIRRSPSTFAVSYYCCFYEVMSAMALIPQLWMFHQDTRVQPLLANFVVLTAMSRVFVLSFWVAYPWVYYWSNPDNRGIQMASEDVNVDSLTKTLEQLVTKLSGGPTNTAIGNHATALAAQIAKEKAAQEQAPQTSKAVRLAEAARELEQANRRYNHKQMVYEQHLAKGAAMKSIEEELAADDELDGEAIAEIVKAKQDLIQKMKNEAQTFKGHLDTFVKDTKERAKEQRKEIRQRAKKRKAEAGGKDKKYMDDTLEKKRLAKAAGKGMMKEE